MTEVGRKRSDSEYVWPPGIVQPQRPPVLVYLDINCWIALAKCMAGHHDGERHTDVLRECQAAVDTGTAVFPISDSTYFEITNISQHRQRRDLREAIEELARYQVVMARSDISALEIEAMLDQRVGPSRTPLGSVSYLDWGVARAFGMVGGFKIRDESGADVTEEAKATHPLGPDGLQLLLDIGELELNRQIIDGPTPDQESEMRALGWRPKPAREAVELRAEQEADQARRFDDNPEWRRGRIRDVVSAREVIIEIQDELNRALQARDIELEEAFPTTSDWREALDSMPSFDVAVTLKTEYHRNPHHNWTANDIHDIDALASTIPYCDIVVTDKAAASAVNQAGLPRRLRTTVLRRLDQLPDALRTAAGPTLSA